MLHYAYFLHIQVPKQTEFAIQIQSLDYCLSEGRQKAEQL